VAEAAPGGGERLRRRHVVACGGREGGMAAEGKRSRLPVQRWIGHV
jgi:hypothetical protein